MFRHRILILSLLLSGCTGLSASYTGRPAIIEGPEYAIASESKDFGEAGLAERFDCAPLLGQTSFLGGLSPAQPIAECRHINIPNTPGKPSYAGRPKLDERGLTLHYSSYLIKSEGEIRELGSLEALRQAYAPIESPAEALSLTLASMPNLERLTATALPSQARPVSQVSQIGQASQTGVPAQIYQPSQQVVYRVDPLQGTRVSVQGQDFLVSNLLFDGTCNSHDSITVAYRVDYLVTRSGQISEQSRQPIYDLGTCPIE